jgi:hypothetical protein
MRLLELYGKPLLTFPFGCHTLWSVSHRLKPRLTKRIPYRSLGVFDKQCPRLPRQPHGRYNQS